MSDEKPTKFVWSGVPNWGEGVHWKLNFGLDNSAENKHSEILSAFAYGLQFQQQPPLLKYKYLKSEYGSNVLQFVSAKLASFNAAPPFLNNPNPAVRLIFIDDSQFDVKLFSDVEFENWEVGDRFTNDCQELSIVAIYPHSRVVHVVPVPPDAPWEIPGTKDDRPK